MQSTTEHLAIASVPVQQFGDLYDEDSALKNGTVFRQLDLPFFAAESVPALERAAQDMLRDPARQDQENDLLKIQKVSFVLDDLRLFLDTHPKDGEALEMMKNVSICRKKLLKEYAARYYPLTADCMAELFEHEQGEACFCWQKGPAPWEGVCV